MCIFQIHGLSLKTYFHFFKGRNTHEITLKSYYNYLKENNDVKKLEQIMVAEKKIQS